MAVGDRSGTVRALPACIVATALLLLACPAQAQIENPETSTPTTLYFHIFDTFNLFPINTQAMDAEFFQVVGSNFPSLPETPLGHHDYNTIYGFSSAGPVEYDFMENGRPRFHPERGIAADVLIDSQVVPVAYFYIDVRDALGGDDGPMVLPDLTVRVTMRQGDDIGPAGTLDAGPIVMSGRLTAHVAAGHAAGPAEDAVAGVPFPDHPVLIPDDAGVVEFAVPLAIEQAMITKSEAFNVRIDWYQGEDELGEDTATSGWLRPVLDPQHRPRLEMAIVNPVYIEFIHPQVAAGTLLIHAGMNSPWGTYDIDVQNITLTVEGPTQPEALRQVVAQNAHVHGLHDQAAEVTYLWEFRDEGAATGDYTIRMEVPNMAGSAVASGQAGFRIDGRQAYGISDEGDVVAPSQTDEDNTEAPMGVLPVAIGILAIAAVARHHKRR